LVKTAFGLWLLAEELLLDIGKNGFWPLAFRD